MLATDAPELEVVVARSPWDAIDITAISRAVYVDECGWMSSEESLQFRDRYTSVSFCLLVRVDSRPVGLMRIVRNSPLGLPVERFVDIRAHIEGRAIECQRLMVVKNYRRMQMPAAPFGIFGALIKATFYYCLKEAIDTIIADVFVDTPTTPIRQLKRLGFRATNLLFRDTELADSSDSTVYSLHMGDLVKNIYAERNPLHDYLISPEAGATQYRRDFTSMEAEHVRSP